LICQDSLLPKLRQVKDQFNIPEIFYLATCNRVAFVMATDQVVDKAFACKFIEAMDMGLCNDHMNTFVNAACIYEDQEALSHLLRTSCSLESLVVGEKEILAQVRKAYENSPRSRPYRRLPADGNELRS
jgi:glutamyl-tRNA reductase